MNTPSFEVQLSTPYGRNHDIQYCVHFRHMLYLLGKVAMFQNEAEKYKYIRGYLENIC